MNIRFFLRPGLLIDGEAFTLLLTYTRDIGTFTFLSNNGKLSDFLGDQIHNYKEFKPLVISFKYYISLEITIFAFDD